jgi:uncharacterized protein (DUF433 family)
MRRRRSGRVLGSPPMSQFDRITINPEVCLGLPTIRGMRITVAFVVKMVKNGHSISEILEWYPFLEEEDIRQAVEYTRVHLCEA